MLKVGFCDFWEPFDSNTNFFTEILKAIGYTIEVTSPEECEVLFFSVYSQNHEKYKNVYKIFVTGENVRPDFSKCSVSLSFDYDTYNGRNVRCPLWLMQFDWFNKGGYTNPEYLIPLSHVEKNPYPVDKETFCTMVVNNFFPDRKSAYDLIQKYKRIDIYGKPWGNWFYGEKKKLDVISKGKFTVCFENTKFKGYYTEKPIHARIARTIPIYSADDDYKSDFNEKGFLHLSQFASAEQFMAHIQEIDNSKDLFEEYINQPIFNTPTYHTDMFENVKDRLKRLI
jgi:hypothetical protein